MTTIQRLGLKAHHLGGVLLVSVLVAGCDTGQPALGGAQGVSTSVTGAAAPMSDSEFRTLSADKQYQVVNKILGSLYKGMPVSEFYDMSEGFERSVPANPELTPGNLRVRLSQPLTDAERAALDRDIVGDPDALNEAGEPDPIEPRFRFDGNRPKQMPLARIHTYPISRDMFSQWMAWHLANTILFSPAEEIDSADVTDVQNLFRRLDLSIMQRRTVRQIVATHQRTVENWRRFRSPEDNTREMMEIYLGIFDNDAEVPLASQACRDLYLTDERSGYKLARTDFPNDEPQLVLNQYVTDCNEFYDVIAAHPLLIPRVVSVLVDYFFVGLDVNDRLRLVQSISASNPQTFDDIFLAILFSREYLLQTERPKSFEENYLSMADRMSWRTHSDVFMGMTSGRGSLSRAYLNEMGWPAMSLKLGRVTAVPLDSLSFANYHKALRETLMLDRDRWRTPLGLQRPSAPSPEPVEPLEEDASARDQAEFDEAVREYNLAVDALPANERQIYDAELAEYEVELARFRQIENLTFAELLDYLFVTAVQRRATDVEHEALKAIAHSNDNLDDAFGVRFVREGRMDDVALIVFDYLSRLPEAYYLPRI